MKYTAFNSLEIATLAVLPLLTGLVNMQTSLLLVLCTLVVYGLSYLCVYFLRHTLTKTYKILFYLVLVATLVSILTALSQNFTYPTLQTLPQSLVFVLLSASILAIAPLYSTEANMQQIISEIVRTVTYFVSITLVVACVIEIVGHGTFFAQAVTKPVAFFQTFLGQFMVVIVALFLFTAITYYIQKAQKSYRWLVARYKMNFKYMQSSQVKQNKGA